MQAMTDSNEITRRYFDSILLEARYWDSDLPSVRTEVFGETFATPIMSAALSHLDNVCPGGAVKMAQEVHAAGALHWTGMGEADELAAIYTNYSFTVVPAAFTIKSASIDPGDYPEDEYRYDVTDPADVVYNGAPQRQPVTIVDTETGETLVEGVDFTISYSADTTNVGTVTVTITGIGNYSGTMTATYRIT
ncbi:MAG: hypothetical protein IJL59_02985, partial [Clostridia bacterium]|nr:hypothetical protein [Clostridia bacterium]